MIYVASPYSSNIIGVQESRYQHVRRFTDRMIQKGFVAFSPIVYCHPIAQRIGHATDANTWIKFNMSILRRCEAMYVLELVGWEQSEGLKIEMNICKMLDIPSPHYDQDFKLVSEEWKGRGLLVEAF